jgi:hypothetical protein
MDFDIDLNHEYDQLRSFYDDTAALLDQPDDVLFTTNASVSGWSPAQHLHHVWLASGKSLAAALYIAYGRGNADGSLGEAGRAVLEAESMPRNQMQAPDAVSPPDDLDRQVLTDTLSRSRGKLDDVGEQLDALAAAEGRLPHPRLGALNGPQWLRFVRIHAQHHHDIIRDILSADPTRPR